MDINYSIISIDTTFDTKRLKESLKKFKRVYIFCHGGEEEAVVNLREELLGVVDCESIIFFDDRDTVDEFVYGFRESNEIKYSVRFYKDNNRWFVYRVTKSRTVDKNRKKLAYFSPFNPTPSGIATYSSELLPYLSKYYDITLVADSSSIDDIDNIYDGIEYEVIDEIEFKQRAKEFQRVLYHIGNSHFHKYALNTLKGFGGVVVLHDFFLSGMHKYIEFEDKEYYHWGLRLFQSHGYLPFKDYFKDENHEELSFEYPVNLEVLQYQTGLITHSHYARGLVDEWYLNNPSIEHRVIPHLRVSSQNKDKNRAREILKLPKDTTIIASFGHINKTKLSHRILDAFISSKLKDDLNVIVILVGNRSDPIYCKSMETRAKEYGVDDRFIITDWIDLDTFNLYLEASDIAIQLRTLSRGETSGTILDAINYQLATITNANGSMAEIPKDIVVMLEDNFLHSDLVEAMERVVYDKSFRDTLTKRAKEYLKRVHDPKVCAKEYYEAIENFYTKVDAIESKSITGITLQSPKPRQKQIFVDVSTLVIDDLRTGVQRVVRAHLLELMKIIPKSVRVEAVYYDKESRVYRYASKYLSKLLKLPIVLKDSDIEIESGDIFYGVDLYRDGVISAYENGVYKSMRAKGVIVTFLIHDLLPIEYPHFFPEGTKEEHIKWLEAISSSAVMLIATSKSGARIVDRYIDQFGFVKPKITSVYLGSDIDSSAPSNLESSEYDYIFDELKKRPTVLMVSTIEPRKGYLQTIRAFRKLWSEDIDVGLIIVGKEGWVGLDDSLRRDIPQTVKELNKVDGDKFWWLKRVDDATLQRLYKEATLFLFSSEDEGFGLPLIEAAYHKLPILVRDRPIFKELAQDSATYFEDSLDEEVIYKALKEWLEDYSKGEYIKSDNFKYITWQESAKRLYSEFVNICKGR